MRWTTKHLWVAALGAGLMVGPAWAQSSRQSDDDYESSSSSRAGSSDGDYGEGRSVRSDQSRSSRSRATGQSDRGDDSWSRDDSDRRSSDRMQNRSNQRSSTRRSSQSDDSWFGADSGNQRSRSTGDDNQWSDWDYDKDIRESGVWRVGNLLGKQVRNSQGEDLGAIEDIVIDLNNRNIRYVAMSRGGVLGVGEQLFAVPLDRLREQQDEDGDTVFVLNVDERTLDNAQGFENRDRWPAQADNSFRTSGMQARSQSSQTSRSARQTASRSGQSSGQANSQQTRSFQGEFEEFDSDANQITVRTSDGRRRIYNVSPNVRVTHQGRQAFLDDMEEGEQLSLSYTTGGDNRTVITSVSDASRHATRGSSGQATRSNGQSSYRLGSYDPNDDQSTSSQRQRSEQQRRSSTSGDRSSANFGTDTSDDDWSDDSSTRSRRSSDRSDAGNRSSDESDSSSYESDDSSSSERSSSRSANRGSSQDDSDSYESSEE